MHQRYLKTNLDEHVSFSLENQIKEAGLLVISFLSSKSKVNKKTNYNSSWEFKGRVRIKDGILDNYLKLMDYLIKKKINIYILGGKDEIELSNLIPSNQYIHNLIDKSPWNIVKKIAFESIVTVSNDTSTMHFISSLGLPVIAIMKDNKYAIRNAPISKGSVVLKNKNIQEIKLQEVVNELSKFI